MYFLGVFVVKDKIFINSIIIGVYFPGFNTNNINYKKKFTFNVCFQNMRI